MYLAYKYAAHHRDFSYHGRTHLMYTCYLRKPAFQCCESDKISEMTLTAQKMHHSTHIKPEQAPV